MIWREVAPWSLSWLNTHTQKSQINLFANEKEEIGALVCSNEWDTLLQWIEGAQRHFSRGKGEHYTASNCSLPHIHHPTAISCIHKAAENHMRNSTTKAQQSLPQSNSDSFFETTSSPLKQWKDPNPTATFCLGEFSISMQLSYGNIMQLKIELKITHVKDSKQKLTFTVEVVHAYRKLWKGQYKCK